MAYSTHRTYGALPNSGAVDDTLTPYTIEQGARRIGVSLRYKAHASSSTGYPAFRVWWRLAGSGWRLATVRNNTIVVGTTEAAISEYIAVVHCRDLTDAGGDDGVATIRSLAVEPGVYQVRLEPYEAGDAAHSGSLEILLAGVP